MRVDAKLRDMELPLPEPFKVPPGFKVPFSWARVRANRVCVSGDGPLDPDGTHSSPVGKRPTEASLELELNGPEIGHHARTAVGMAGLPMNSPVLIAAEIEFE